MEKPTEKAHRARSEKASPTAGDERSDRRREGDISEVEDIIEQASYRDADSFLRQTLRGDETLGDADARDVAGATDFGDTPHGREETKNDKAGAVNQNG